jgi:hypothetical protein
LLADNGYAGQPITFRRARRKYAGHWFPQAVVIEEGAHEVFLAQGH